MNNLTTEIKVQVLENGRITFTYFNFSLLLYKLISKDLYHIYLQIAIYINVFLEQNNKTAPTYQVFNIT